MGLILEFAYVGLYFNLDCAYVVFFGLGRVFGLDGLVWISFVFLLFWQPCFGLIVFFILF